MHKSSAAGVPEAAAEIEEEEEEEAEKQGGRRAVPGVARNLRILGGSNQFCVRLAACHEE